MRKTILTEENISLMNTAQKKVVLTQWAKHQHDDFKVDYDTPVSDLIFALRNEFNITDSIRTEICKLAGRASSLERQLKEAERTIESMSYKEL